MSSQIDAVCENGATGTGTAAEMRPCHRTQYNGPLPQQEEAMNESNQQLLIRKVDQRALVDGHRSRCQYRICVDDLDYPPGGLQGVQPRGCATWR